MKVGIVGAQESSWTERQKDEVPTEIHNIFTWAVSHVLVKHGLNLSYDAKKDITLVSGRCPVSICDNCGKHWFSNIADPIAGHVWCEFCGHKKKRRAGGVDIWAEEIAIKLGLKTEIYAPEVNRWRDAIIKGKSLSKERCHSLIGLEVETISKTVGDVLMKSTGRIRRIEEDINPEHFWLVYCNGWHVALDNVISWKARKKGYCSRNLDVVNAIPLPPDGVIHCINPKGKRSGGTWTMEQAKKMGKETHLIEVG